MDGRQLRHLRLEQGLSQNQLAALSGVPASTISKCEIGINRVTAYLAGRFENGLTEARRRTGANSGK